MIAASSGYSDRALRQMSPYSTLPSSMTSSRHSRTVLPLDDGYNHHRQLTPSSTASAYQRLPPPPSTTPMAGSVGHRPTTSSPTAAAGLTGGFSVPLQVGNGVVR